MYEFSGTFGSVTVQIQPTGQYSVKMADFFGWHGQSFINGTPSGNKTGYWVGVHPDRLPYHVAVSGRVSLDYATNNIHESRRNFYVRGTAGDGYYGIMYN